MKLAINSGGLGDYVTYSGCADRIMDPGGVLPQLAQSAGLSGLGCGCAGVGCAGAGLGLFDTGLDLSGWGVTEWALVALGVYVLGSLWSDTGRVVSRARGASRRRQKKAEAVERARRKLAEAEKG